MHCPWKAFQKSPHILVRTNLARMAGCNLDISYLISKALHNTGRCSQVRIDKCMSLFHPTTFMLSCTTTHYANSGISTQVLLTIIGVRRAVLPGKSRRAYTTIAMITCGDTLPVIFAWVQLFGTVFDSVLTIFSLIQIRTLASIGIDLKILLRRIQTYSVDTSSTILALVSSAIIDVGLTVFPRKPFGTVTLIAAFLNDFASRVV